MHLFFFFHSFSSHTAANLLLNIDEKIRPTCFGRGKNASLYVAIAACTVKKRIIVLLFFIFCISCYFSPSFVILEAKWDKYVHTYLEYFCTQILVDAYFKRIKYIQRVCSIVENKYKNNTQFLDGLLNHDHAYFLHFIFKIFYWHLISNSLCYHMN